MGDHLTKKTPLPARETKLRKKGRIWRKRKKLEEKEIFGRIGKNWKNWRKSGKLTKFGRGKRKI